MNSLRHSYWKYYYLGKIVRWFIIILASLAVGVIAIGIGSWISGMIIDALY